MFPFHKPLKVPESQRFFGVFREHWRDTSSYSNNMLPVREEVQGLGEQNNFLLNGGISLRQTVKVEDTSL